MCHLFNLFPSHHNSSIEKFKDFSKICKNVQVFEKARKNIFRENKQAVIYSDTEKKFSDRKHQFFWNINYKTFIIYIL